MWSQYMLGEAISNTIKYIAHNPSLEVSVYAQLAESKVQLGKLGTDLVRLKFASFAILSFANSLLLTSRRYTPLFLFYLSPLVVFVLFYLRSHPKPGSCAVRQPMREAEESKKTRRRQQSPGLRRNWCRRCCCSHPGLGQMGPIGRGGGGGEIHR